MVISGRISLRASTGVAPSRKTVGAPTNEITVDSKPVAVGPASKIGNGSSGKSCSTCKAVVGEMWLDRLALGAPSANRSNHISPTTALHVEHDFPEDPFPILDAGPTATGLESTVISLVGAPTVLRLGATPVEALREILPEITTHIPEEQVDSPGTSKRHYA